MARMYNVHTSSMVVLVVTSRRQPEVFECVQNWTREPAKHSRRRLFTMETHLRAITVGARDRVILVTVTLTRVDGGTGCDYILILVVLD